jgi:tetratricopeptide (TPR) repeat protein
MRRIVFVSALIVALLSPLSADTTQTMAAVDALHDQGKYQEAVDAALAAVASATPQEKAELYWRVSREVLNLGDAAEKAKQSSPALQKIFLEGQQYAQKAMDADPSSCFGYYWKAANIGRWGQVKGILDSLFQAGPMRDLLIKDLALNSNHADAYYVLGQLYREVPGWPLSFGNGDYAVSLGRQAVDMRAAQLESGQEKILAYSFYTELAKSLYKRNWSASNRVKEQAAKRTRYGTAKDALERGFNYEGTAVLPDVSDRDEAKTMVQWVVTELEKKAGRTSDDDNDLTEARDVLKGWK